MCFQYLTLTSCIRGKHMLGFCNYSSSWMNTTAWCQWFSSKKGRPKHCQRPEDWKMKPSVSLYSRWINSFTPTSSSLREVNRKTLYLRWTLFICAGMQWVTPMQNAQRNKIRFYSQGGRTHLNKKTFLPFSHKFLWKFSLPVFQWAKRVK